MSIQSSIRKNGWAWAGLVFLLLPFLCWLFAPFMIEDAYITFRYSRHLAMGWGPVYNFGEAVEGYTAPLWMLLMAIPHFLGLSVERFASILGCLALAGTGLLWMKMLAPEFGGKGKAFLLALAVVSQSTLLGFSFSGMETAQNLFVLSLLLVWGLKLFAAPFKRTNAFILALLVFLALFSRPDNALFVLVLLLVVLWEWKIGAFSAFKTYFLNALLLLLPLLALYAAWKLSFYGQLLPNTFYAKGGGHFRQGIQYLFLFTMSSGLPLLWGLAAFIVIRKKELQSPLVKFALIFPLMWMLYILWAGGDFMEFRLMAPAIPFMIFIAAKGAIVVFKKAGSFWFVAAGLIACNLFLSLALVNWYYPGFLVTMPRLAEETGHPEKGNVVMGKKLHALFGKDEGLRFASGGAGAMPYFADVYMLDMIGLNDAEIAQEGSFTAGIPGHQRFASFELLQRRNIHLVVGTWRLKGDTTTSCQANNLELKKAVALDGPLPKGVRLLSIPLEADWELRIVYLKTHPAVESAIVAGKLREIELVW